MSLSISVYLNLCLPFSVSLYNCVLIYLFLSYTMFIYILYVKFTYFFISIICLSIFISVFAGYFSFISHYLLLFSFSLPVSLTNPYMFIYLSVPFCVCASIYVSLLYEFVCLSNCFTSLSFKFISFKYPVHLFVHSLF